MSEQQPERTIADYLSPLDALEKDAVVLYEKTGESAPWHELPEPVRRTWLSQALADRQGESLPGPEAARVKPVGDDEFVQLVVHPALRPALWAWLASRDLRTGRIPTAEEDLPTYVVSPASWASGG